MRFDAAFTTPPHCHLCSLARTSFYTGLYPHKHGVTANSLCIDEGIRVVNDYLAEAGYRRQMVYR